MSPVKEPVKKDLFSPQFFTGEIIYKTIIQLSLAQILF